MPAVQIYIRKELYTKWLNIPDGDRSAIIQKAINCYRKPGTNKPLSLNNTQKIERGEGKDGHD